MVLWWCVLWEYPAGLSVLPINSNALPCDWPRLCEDYWLFHGILYSRINSLPSPQLVIANRSLTLFRMLLLLSYHLLCLSSYITTVFFYYFYLLLLPFACFFFLFLLLIRVRKVVVFILFNRPRCWSTTCSTPSLQVTFAHLDKRLLGGFRQETILNFDKESASFRPERCPTNQGGKIAPLSCQSPRQTCTCQMGLSVVAFKKLRLETLTYRRRYSVFNA